MMAANFAISLIGWPTEVDPPQFCVPAPVSVTARPCQRRQVRGKLHPNRDPSREFQFSAVCLQDSERTRCGPDQSPIRPVLTRMITAVMTARKAKRALPAVTQARCVRRPITS